MVVVGARQVVEAVGRPEVRDRGARHRLVRAVHEPAQLLEQLVVQAGLVPADLRGRRVHAHVPAGLVEPQRRPAPELTRGGGDDAVGDQVPVHAERFPRAPRVQQPPDDLGVHHQMLDAAAGQPVPPPGHVALRSGRRALHPRRPVAQLVHERPRAVVAPRRARVARERRRGVGEQHRRVEHRALRPVHAVAPERVQRVLQPVRERPVGRIVERARGRHRPRGPGGGEEHRSEQGGTSEHEATAGTGAGAIGPAAGGQRDATGWGGRHGEHFLGSFRAAGAVCAGRS